MISFIILTDAAQVWSSSATVDPSLSHTEHLVNHGPLLFLFQKHFKTKSLFATAISNTLIQATIISHVGYSENS